MPFSCELCVAELAGGELGLWRLDEDLHYLGCREEFVIPAGFVGDFASIPRLFWNILPPFGKHSRSAWLHDFLYATHLVSRQDADGLFLRTMEEYGVSWWRRRLMHRAVRLFGFGAWERANHAYTRGWRSWGSKQWRAIYGWCPADEDEYLEQFSGSTNF